MALSDDLTKAGYSFITGSNGQQYVQSAGNQAAGISGGYQQLAPDAVSYLNQNSIPFQTVDTSDNNYFSGTSMKLGQFGVNDLNSQMAAITSFGNQNQPAAAAPSINTSTTSPAAAPGVGTTSTASAYVPPTPSINVTAGSNQPAPSSTGSQAAASPSVTAAPPPSLYQGNSVVDALNAAGQPSDFTSRAQLAASEGIKNYTGSAAQNAQLIANIGSKYKAAQASSSGEAPASAGDARAAVTAAANNAAPTMPDPVTNAIDTVTSQYFQDINSQNNVSSTMMGVQDYINQESASLGIPALNTQLMNIDNLMNGTDNDVRAEISAAGGFATESQVEATVGARNKVLQVQATNIQNQLANANQTLSLMTSGYSEDRSNAIASLNTKVSNDAGVLSVFQNMQTQASANYSRIFTASGWGGLAAMTDSSKANIETTWGLPAGSLSNPDWVNSQQDALYRQQQLMNAKQNITINETKDDAQASYYGTRTVQAANAAASDVISGYTSQAGYTSFTSAQPIMGRIDEASNNPGSVSDAELVRAFGNLTNVNSSVTDSEAGSISGGTSFLQDFSALQNKVESQGGSLSQNQRNQIYSLSHAIYNNYKEAYAPIYNNALNALNDQGLPNGVLPNPNTFVAPNENIGDASGVSIGGITYASGQTIQAGNGSMTVQPDGTLLGSDGETYTVVNGQIQ